MRNSRRLFGGLLLALVLSGGVLSADAGSMGGPNRGTCGFIDGILYKVGNPELLQAILYNLFDCP